MTTNTAGLVTVATGVITILLLLVGLGAVASVFAAIQLLGLVGLPLAIGLVPELKLWPTVGVVAVALSISLSAIAVQSLIWFGWASPAAIVAAATAYGVALSWALNSPSTADKFQDEGL